MIIFGLVFPMNILKLQKFRIDQKVHNGIPERPLGQTPVSPRPTMVAGPWWTGMPLRSMAHALDSRLFI
jgi:hypothetical protein